MDSKRDILFNNLVDEYVKGNGIDLFETASVYKDIVLVNPEEFVNLLGKKNVSEVFFRYTEKTDENIPEVSENEIDDLLEEKYKYIYCLNQKQDYFDKYNRIIQEAIDKVLKTLKTGYTEYSLEYFFIQDRISYSISFVEIDGTPGEESSNIDSYELNYRIVKASEKEILKLGKDFGKEVGRELDELMDYLKNSIEYAGKKTKAQREAFFVETLENGNYPCLEVFRANPTSFRKVPDFYISFSKEYQSRYAEMAYWDNKFLTEDGKD